MNIFKVINYFGIFESFTILFFFFYNSITFFIYLIYSSSFLKINQITILINESLLLIFSFSVYMIFLNYKKNIKYKSYKSLFFFEWISKISLYYYLVSFSSVIFFSFYDWDFYSIVTPHVIFYLIYFIYNISFLLDLYLNIDNNIYKT